MKRTTIMLPDELHERLRREAFRCRISMGALIRSKLEDGRRPRSRRKPMRDPLLEVEGIGHDSELSKNIDEALYGI